MTNIYQDPVIEKYIALLKTKLTGKIKMFYQGDPLKIPQSNLPCIVISRNQTRIAQETNAEDGHEMGLIITVVTDTRADLSTNEDVSKIAPGIATLYELVEGRDPSTFALRDDSVLGILRKNQLVDSANNLRTDLRSVTRVDYGETIRQKSPDIYAIEARIEIVVNFIQLR